MLITKADEAMAEISWRRKPLCYKVNADESAYKTGFKDGYNKANDKIEALEERCEIANDEIIRLQKANEWYKVRDKLPPMDEVVYLWHENERFPVYAYRHIPYGKTEKDWLWECYWGSGYTVTQSVAKDYQWKEIVLPKED